jgi:hypothetical protein
MVTGVPPALSWRMGVLMKESARLSHCVGNPSLVVQSIKLYKQVHQGIGESEHLGH